MARGLAAAIQMLNAVGALTLVFAFRYGKAIIVSPLVNAGAPLLTALLSLVAGGGHARTIQDRRHRAGADRRAAAGRAARGVGAAMKTLLDIVARHKRGEQAGVYSLCSAHLAGYRERHARGEREQCAAARRGHVESSESVRRLYGHDAGGLPSLRRSTSRGKSAFARRCCGWAAIISGPNAWRHEPADVALAKVRRNDPA